MIASVIWGVVCWLQTAGKPSDAIILKLTFNDGPYAKDTSERNPFDMMRAPNDYVVGTAKRCKIGTFKTWNNQDTTDVPRTAWMQFDRAYLTNKQLNCLTSLVRPVYVSMTFESRK